jgi:hypothetical protein
MLRKVELRTSSSLSLDSSHLKHIYIFVISTYFDFEAIFSRCGSEYGFFSGSGSRSRYLKNLELKRSNIAIYVLSRDANSSRDARNSMDAKTS